MKACQNCYYCNDSFQFAGTWWCACSNQSRSFEASFKNRHWGKSSLNLPCWTSTPPTTIISIGPNLSKLPQYKHSRKLKRVSRFKNRYPNNYMTIPWSYILRSKIGSLTKKHN